MKTEIITLPSGTKVTVKTGFSRREKTNLQKILYGDASPEEFGENKVPTPSMSNVLDFRLEGVNMMVVGMSEEQIDALEEEDIEHLEQRFDEFAATMGGKKKPLKSLSQESSEETGHQNQPA